MRPSLRQLEYVVAVAEAGHFGRAARACHVTQPALSTQIRALEEELGVALFERSRRGAVPTPVGRWVVARARALLAGMDELVEVARGGREPMSGPVHLGVIPTVAPYLLPRWLPAVRERWPKLRLYLHEAQTAALLRGLEEGRLDAALLALPAGGERLVELPILREPFVLIAPRGHPLARSRRRVRPDELAGTAVLLLEDGHCLRDQALALCSQAGAREAEEVRAASLATLVQMVIGGLGVTLLPECALEAELRGAREVVVRRFVPPPPGREIGLVWRRSSPRADEFRALGEWLRTRRPGTRRSA